jgi:hypothetical protein
VGDVPGSATYVANKQKALAVAVVELPFLFVDALGPRELRTLATALTRSAT